MNADAAPKDVASAPPDEVVTRSLIRCPECGHRREETMPEDACLYFYECTGCGTLLRPLTGDCCVFCSYGSVACPPVQRDGRCNDC